jgi:hypothetical protein
MEQARGPLCCRVCLSMGHACDPELDGLAVGHQPSDDAGCPCVNLARMGA